LDGSRPAFAGEAEAKSRRGGSVVAPRTDRRTWRLPPPWRRSCSRRDKRLARIPGVAARLKESRVAASLRPEDPSL
jgi:hypothetical protein